MIEVYYTTPDVRYRPAPVPFTSVREGVADSYTDQSSEAKVTAAPTAVAMQYLGGIHSAVNWTETTLRAGWYGEEGEVARQYFVAAAYATAEGYEVEVEVEDPSEYGTFKHVVVKVPDKQLTPSPTWEEVGMEEMEDRLDAIFGWTATPSYPSRGDVPDVEPVAFWTRHLRSRETL